MCLVLEDVLLIWGAVLVGNERDPCGPAGVYRRNKFHMADTTIQWR